MTQVQRLTIPKQPFPFPFQSDSYRYSNNSRKLNPPFLPTITPHYYEEIKAKRELLEKHSERTYQSFDFTLDAQWEVLEMIIHQLIDRYPEYFSLDKHDHSWTLRNDLLGEEYQFQFGDSSSLPCEPLDFIGRHIQEDLIYLSHRDGDLYMDAGQLCFPANWSIAFNLGMKYTEFHSPVPQFSTNGLMEKVRNFLLRMEAGEPWTRYNWTITVNPILDTFPENFNEWGPMKEELTEENVGQKIYLRVEDQRLFRLPQSNGILFGIHTSLISLEELSQNRNWADMFNNIINDIPDYMAEYKGFNSYKQLITAYLQNQL